MRAALLRLTVAIATAVAVLLPAAPAQAATATFTVAGSVACQRGADVTGIWVQSSAGGSGWAKKANRTTAKWIANYSYTIKFSSSSASPSSKVELHIGCGGTSAKWGSNNKFSLGTLTASKDANALCNDKTGVNGFTCRSWAKDQVLIAMPFTGTTSGDATSHTKWDGHNVAEDIYAKPGTTAKIWAYAPRGVSVVLTASPASSGVCGTVNVTVTAGGQPAGVVHFGHLVPTAKAKKGGTIANGTSLGTTKRWPYLGWKPGASCAWEVTDDFGVHTHLALTSGSGDFACFATYESSRKAGRWIGMIGDSPASGPKKNCPMS